LNTNIIKKKKKTDKFYKKFNFKINN